MVLSVDQRGVLYIILTFRSQIPFSVAPITVFKVAMSTKSSPMFFHFVSDRNDDETKL